MELRFGELSSFRWLSTAGDNEPSGQPGCGLTRELCNGVGAERSCTSSFGGRSTLREDEDCLWCVGTVGVGVEPVAFLAACFCSATTIGDRISFMCFSINTGFF